MLKIRLAMESSGNNPMDGDIQVDKFTSGGKEEKKQGRSYNSKKKKIVGAVELTENGKIKRFYATIINDFSSKSLPLFLKNLFQKMPKLKLIIGEVINHLWPITK